MYAKNYPICPVCLDADCRECSDVREIRYQCGICDQDYKEKPQAERCCANRVAPDVEIERIEREPPKWTTPHPSSVSRKFDRKVTA